MDPDDAQCRGSENAVSQVPAIVLGVPIDSYDMSGTIKRLAELIELGRSTGRTHQVATVNLDFLVNALADPDIMTILQQADLNLADGMPLVWASRLLGARLPERVAGADLVPLLAQASEQHGWRIHLFGAAPGVADRARFLLSDRHPGSRITSDAGPFIGDIEELDAAIIASIRAVDPDVLCVALGNPKQERFIAAYRDALGSPVMIGVGGSLDMLVGDKKRAPEFAQRIGAEWLFRAAQEPGRLGRRYAHDLRVLAPQAYSYLDTVRRYRTEPPLTVEVVGRCVVVRAGTPTASVPAIADEQIDAVELDFSGFLAVAAESHSLIISIIREARLHAVPITVKGIAPALRDCLENYGTWPMFASATRC
jgi:N-acetylglucosaminyldiphosphoundecaprenol N-acetyl-beta-D-mannosaminyltransferase